MANGKGISINFVANVRDFLRGTKNVEEAFEDVADSLDDVARDGDKSTERLERSFKELEKKAGKSTRDMADDLARNTKRGANRASGELKELGNEAKQNAAETFSSFDGSAESFADGIQGTLGGIVSSMGPVGAAIGAASAIGLGFLLAGLQRANEETERLKEIAAELGKEYLETGEIGQTSMEYLVKVVEALATATGEGTDSLKGLKKIADDADDSLADLAQSAGMSEEELRDLWRESDRLAESLIDQRKAQDLSTEAGQEQAQILQEQADAQEAYRDEIGKAIGVSVAAGEAAKAAAEAGLPELRAKAALIDTVNTAYDKAAGAATDFVDNETSLFDTEAYLAAMHEREDALRNYQRALAEADLSPEAKSFIDSQGVEAAAAFLQGYKSASPAQKTEMNRLWTEAAKDNSGAYETAISNAFETPLPAPKIERPVVPAPDLSKVKRALAGSHTLKVTVAAVTRSGQRIL